MIAYDELSAALDRWRARMGLPATPPLFGDGRGGAPPGPRATQAVAAVPAPSPSPAAAAPPAAASAVRSPPPPPSGRSTMIGMAAPVIGGAPPAAAPSATAAMPLTAPPDEDALEAEVLEETGDPYDNAGTDFAQSFDGSTVAGGEAASSADGWPEARTVMTHGWGQQPAPAPRTIEVDDVEEATQIGDETRHD
jgi:hypothetical protein